MAKLQFGTTWWGRKWLEALQQGQSDPGRESRGRSYFTRGRVLGLEIENETGRLLARVQGTAARPYRVTLRLPRIDPEKARRLASALAAHPQTLALLLEHQLEPGFDELARSFGVNLFPASAEDFAPVCTCPDEPGCCKHVWAVFYALVRRIDTDPFELFRLGGVDFGETLRGLGVDLEAQSRTGILTIDSFLFWKLPAAEAGAAAGSEPPKGFEAVPLYRLQPMEKALLSLLPEKFALLPGGRPWLARVWNRLKKNAARCWTQRSQEAKSDVWRFIDRGPLGSYGPVVPRIGLFDDTLDFIRPHPSGAQPRALSERRPAGWLLGALLELGRAEAQAHSAGLAFWEQLVTIALALMKNGAVAPVLVRHQGARQAACTLAWEPALASSLVREIVASGARAMDSSGVKPLELPPERTGTPEGRFLTVLTVLITAFSHYFQENAGRERMKLVPGLFLDRYRCLEEGACDSEIQALERYLRPLVFYQSSTRWKPVVTLRRTKGEDLSANLGIVPAAAAREIRPVLLRDLLSSPDYAADRYSVLSDFQILAKAYPPLSRVIETGGLAVRVPQSDLKGFLFDSKPALELLGARVLLPRSLRKLLRPSLVARISGSAGGSARSFFTKEMLSEFSWKVAVGGHELTEEQFRQLARHSGEIARLGEDYVWLDPEDIDRIEKKLSSRRAPGYAERLRAVLTGKLDGARVVASSDILAELRRMNRSIEVRLPESVHATLRPYQMRGFCWLVKNLKLGLGSLIADDMGLGKTLQVIAAIAWLKDEGGLERGRVLAAVPASLLVNWVREIRRFAPSLSCAIYHGQDRRLPGQEQMPDVLLTTYGTLRRDFDALSKRRWRLLVLDEAQAVKNTGTEAYGAASAFPASQVIAMTGTPVENRLMEYWSIFSIVQPGFLGSTSEFRTNFVNPIEGEHDPEVSEAFRRLVAPLMLRRVKTDRSVIEDLPERLVQDVPVRLLPAQAALYERALQEALPAISEAEKGGAKDRVRRKALVLRLITELKQICNSPSQYLKTREPEPDSAKAQALLEILAECRSNRRKALVFTQYREMGERLQDWIEKRFGRRPQFLNGSVAVSQRAAMVDDFQNNPDSDILLVSLKAGGTGLNLTSASVVVHYDLWWNPAVENQASDRAWRIGQQRDVLILRFVTEGTFEERINEMLTEKRRLADLAVGEGERWIGDLSSSQIEELFGLGREGG
ncbi:SNF2-related protein [Mesosutterella sp. AGMB02718]|uniref:SNF2-related protein n=1 Tax=Mesosutterella faecium TaxID=2925194 RepID=A0ABT7IQN4_9BURK|nr:SNF2-related protein [Mesosutterella sp. AGMB02718]MDL2059582.1 SNF2-related protein [Mesosutterella sp. AGMB02718]